MTMRIGAPWLFLALLPLARLGAAAPVPVSLSYSTTVTDPSGTQRSISFTGTASDRSLSGTLIVDGAPMLVTATLGPDGSVSGKLTSGDGTQQRGTFWGRPTGSGSTQGSFDLNGQVGEWTVPLRLPRSGTDNQ